jgi:Gas vesicle protein
VRGCARRIWCYVANVANFVTVASKPNRYLDRPSLSSLADVIDTILDKGLVIDIYVRVSSWA